MVKEFIGKLEKQAFAQRLKGLDPILRQVIIEMGLTLPRESFGKEKQYFDNEDLKELEKRNLIYLRTKDQLKAKSEKYGKSPTEFEKADSYVVDILQI